MLDFLDFVLAALIGLGAIVGLMWIGHDNAERQHMNNCMKAMEEMAHKDAIRTCDYVVLGKEMK